MLSFPISGIFNSKKPFSSDKVPVGKPFIWIDTEGIPSLFVAFLTIPFFIFCCAITKEGIRSIMTIPEIRYFLDRRLFITLLWSKKKSAKIGNRPS